MNSLDELFFLPEEERRAGDGTIVLATVYAVDEDEGLTLIFDGDSSASLKKYKMLMNGKTPAAGDRVAAVKHSGTYIVLGVIGTNGGSTPATASPNTVFAGPASGEDPDEAAFRALVPADLPAAYVEKDGDTMTDFLQIKSPSLHRSNPPSSSSDGVGKGIKLIDADGNVLADLKPSLWTDGSVSVTLQALAEVSGADASNWITITQRKNGDKEMSLGQPVPVNMGGTGTSSFDTIRTGVFTAATGFTLSTATLYKWGRLYQLSLYIKKDSADSSTDMVMLGRLGDRLGPIIGAVCGTSDGRFGSIYYPAATLPAAVYIQGPFTTSYFNVRANYLGYA